MRSALYELPNTKPVSSTDLQILLELALASERHLGVLERIDYVVNL